MILVLLIKAVKICTDRTHLGALAASPLLLDHSALSLYLLIFEEKTTAPVTQREQHAVN